MLSRCVECVAAMVSAIGGTLVAAAVMGKAGQGTAAAEADCEAALGAERGAAAGPAAQLG